MKYPPHTRASEAVSQIIASREKAKREFAQKPMQQRLDEARYLYGVHVGNQFIERLPVVQLRAQGKPLLVLVSPRGLFIASFSWERLVEKIRFHEWKVIGDTLDKRLRAWKERHNVSF